MTTDGRKDLQQRPGPGRIRTRWRARQDQRGTGGGSEGTGQGEEQQQQQYPDGGARSTRQISVRPTFATRGSWSRSEQATDECPNSRKERKRAHKQRVSGVFAIAKSWRGHLVCMGRGILCNFKVISVVCILEHFCSRSSVLSFSGVVSGNVWNSDVSSILLLAKSDEWR